MKVKTLIKILSKLDQDAEVIIGGECTKPLEDIVYGWYVDDGFDAPDIIDEKENPEDYGVDAAQNKVVCLS